MRRLRFGLVGSRIGRGLRLLEIRHERQFLRLQDPFRFFRSVLPFRRRQQARQLGHFLFGIIPPADDDSEGKNPPNGDDRNDPARNEAGKTQTDRVFPVRQLFFALLRSVGQVVKNGLELLGVSAPESM